MVPADALEPRVPSGAVVYLTRGPRRVGGHDWWEIQPETLPEVPPSPFGWVRASDDDGHPALVPLAPACPPADRLVEAAAIRALGGIVALACFGSETVTLEGRVRCLPAARDGGIAGPSWLDFYAACGIDDVLALNGALVSALLDDGARPPDPVTGRYRVRGHFDDPEASVCHWVPVGVTVSEPIAPPEPDAVILCRQAFVVTALEPLGD